MNGTLIHIHDKGICVVIEVPDVREAPVLVHLGARQADVKCGTAVTAELDDARAIELLDALRERYGETEVRP